MSIFLLTSSAVLGAVWCVVLFLVCFVCVHLVKLAKIGFDVTKKQTKKPSEQPPNEHTNSQNHPDGKTPSGQRSVYYFVKQKRRDGQTVYRRSKGLRYK